MTSKSSTSKPSTSSEKEVYLESTLVPSNNSDISEFNENLLTISESDSKLSTITNRKRPSHGSGSNLARTKVALKNRWLTYLKTKDEHDKIADVKYAKTLEQKKEMIKLKKNILL